MNIAVISCSLHPLSRSYIMARHIVEEIESLGSTAQLHDLRHYKIELRDVNSGRRNNQVQELARTIQTASAVILAVPIYNFYANAATKNLIELTGDAWNKRVVGFICAAGGKSSYMSIMNLANSLMLDFRCFIVPQFVYATGDAFDNDRTEDMYLSSAEVKERLRELAEITTQLASAMGSVGLL